MNQHSVQAAYLKKFEEKGRIWAHENVGVKPHHYTRRKCTMEVDFQSEQLDSIQNNSIEKPAIDVIRSLYRGVSITDDQAFKLFSWTELHLIRNQKFRSQAEINYNEEYDLLLDAEKNFRQYFNCISVYHCDEGEYLITSDNPILDLCFSEMMIRIFVISPKTLVMMSPRKGFPTTEISFTEMINSSIYANRYKYIFSNKKKLPLDLFEDNSNKYNLVGEMTRQNLVVVN